MRMKIIVKNLADVMLYHTATLSYQKCHIAMSGLSYIWLKRIYNENSEIPS